MSDPRLVSRLAALRLLERPRGHHAPPEFGSGTVGGFTASGTGPKLLVHTTLSGSTRTERWVLFDKAFFTGGSTQRFELPSGSQWQQDWSTVKGLIDENEVEGFFEVGFSYRVPPADDTDTGETGTFQTFQLKRFPAGGGSPTTVGGLLRIAHADGTYTDHWALWDGYTPPSSTQHLGCVAVSPGFSSVGDFYEQMLTNSANWNHDPQKGHHAWIRNYTIASSMP